MKRKAWIKFFNNAIICNDIATFDLSSKGIKQIVKLLKRE